MVTYAPEVLEHIITTQDKFVWEAPEYPKYERTKSWYLVMTLVAVFLVAYAVWTANFLFAFIILLSAIVLVLAGNKEPNTVLIQIGDIGIVFNGKFFPFRDLQNFAVIYQPPMSKVLYIEHGGLVRPRLRISLEDQDPLQIRSHLLRYVPENLDLRDEHLSDILARLFRI